MDARPAPDGAADQLPAGPAVFVGRRTELAALRAAAARPAEGRSTVLVLAGRPGSGRTTLAVRFARAVAADYPDGLLFARLSAPDGGRAAPGQVARRLLEQLGAPVDAMLLPGAGEEGRDDPACVRLRAALAGRRVLLLLDDVKDAGQLWPLLADEPGCLVVATTAGPLTGIEDIDPCILGGLEQPTAVGLLGELVGGNRISCDPVGGADLAEACASRPAALRLMAGWLRASPKAAVTDAARELITMTGVVGGAAKAGAVKAGAVKGAVVKGAAVKGGSAGADTVNGPVAKNTGGPAAPSAARGAPGGTKNAEGAEAGGAAVNRKPAGGLPVGGTSGTAPSVGGTPVGVTPGGGAPGKGAAPAEGGPAGRPAAGRPGKGRKGRAGAGRPAAAAGPGLRTPPVAPAAGPTAGPAGPAGPAPANGPAGAPGTPGRTAAADAGDRPSAVLPPGSAEPVPVPDNDPLIGAFTLLYATLPPAQARMLRTLTLAPAQIADLRTASALVGCPAPDAAAALAALAGHELLGEEPPAADGTPRYRVPGRLHPRLVQLREAVDRPAETELARARLLERLVRLVDSARALLDPAGGPAPEPLPGPLRLRSAVQARQWLLGERDLLLGAVADAIGQGDLDGSAGRLVTALLRALPLTGAAAPADLHQLHGLVLRVAERHGAPRRAAAALLNLADLHVAAGHWEQAAERFRAALEAAREAQDEPACARALEGAAGCHRALGDAVRAADGYGRALALRQGLGDQPAEARLLARVAEAHVAQRRFEEAEREYRASLAVLRRLGDERGREAVTAAVERLREQVDGGW
ncbi:tetratricopeptide repeat protein [Kitasatospora sp. NBC_00240]|uniref:tetratricopeptide repeat protein n=1 Tax=Kitasatospora sp. NBC_00240 TaxID=2903567 RepID=UPI00225A6A50|nr:tetratricopeptide repeat protein [Kitasatospora sp. NBC_00240]MCX5210125.1 tetratricopeptide repeat protein [Kitasatospora sp. NBC_00240]